MGVTLAIGIMHVPTPEREKTLWRLVEQLDFERSGIRQLVIGDDSQREGSYVNARRIWAQLLDSDATHCVLLADDNTVCSRFADVMTRMIEAHPDEVIAAYCNHDAARRIEGHWYTTSEGAVQCTLPMPLLRECTAWCDANLDPSKHVAEDYALNLWCMATGRRIWHPVPAPLDHDTAVPSLSGHEDHAFRRPAVVELDGDALMAIDWTGDGVHIGRCYRRSHWGLLTHVRPERWRANRVVERIYELERDACAP